MSPIRVAFYTTATTRKVIGNSKFTFRGGKTRDGQPKGFIRVQGVTVSGSLYDPTSDEPVFWPAGINRAFLNALLDAAEVQAA
jgi:hypothetical protein